MEKLETLHWRKSDGVEIGSSSLKVPRSTKIGGTSTKIDGLNQDFIYGYFFR
jgi:hypothetical protein